MIERLIPSAEEEDENWGTVCDSLPMSLLVPPGGAMFSCHCWKPWCQQKLAVLAQSPGCLQTADWHFCTLSVNSYTLHKLVIMLTGCLKSNHHGGRKPLHTGISPLGGETISTPICRVWWNFTTNVTFGFLKCRAGWVQTQFSLQPTVTRVELMISQQREPLLRKFLELRIQRM